MFMQIKTCFVNYCHAVGFSNEKICGWQSLALSSEVGLQQHMYIFLWYEIKLS